MEFEINLSVATEGDFESPTEAWDAAAELARQMTAKTHGDDCWSIEVRVDYIHSTGPGRRMWHSPPPEPEPEPDPAGARLIPED